MKRMLINASQPEELRIALVDGDQLYDLVLDHPALERRKNNVYKGRVTRVEPSLDAAFVDYGGQRQGFLPLKAISHGSFSQTPADAQNVKISNVIKEGDEVLVQVDKEERGTKGVALTTFISLAGRYMVLMPNNPRVGNMSKDMGTDERKAMAGILKQIEVPEGMGYIIRTAGASAGIERLQWDLQYLTKTWQSIQQAHSSHRAPQLLYEEESSVLRALRDYVREDIGEIWIDDPKTHQGAVDFASKVMPENAGRIKLYDEIVPLFSRYRIEHQIEGAHHRKTQLPSGGHIVIDVTEALVAVDVNSARSTDAGDIEQTALQTNLETAAAVALQLRIRDIGGLIVIDFIDMSAKAHRQQVEDALRSALSQDRANIQVGSLSRFGLLEMSRQRLRSSLLETSSEICAHCNGHGTVRHVKSVALSVLRLLYEEAQKEMTAEIRARVAPEVAAWLLNEKRNEINTIEQRNHLRLLILPHPGLESPRFEITRLRPQDKSARDAEASYEVLKISADEMAQQQMQEQIAEYQTAPSATQQAVVRGKERGTAAPVNDSPTPRARRAERGGNKTGKRTGLLPSWISTLFSGGQAAENGGQAADGGGRRPAKTNARPGPAEGRRPARNSQRTAAKDRPGGSSSAERRADGNSPAQRGRSSDRRRGGERQSERQTTRSRSGAGQTRRREAGDSQNRSNGAARGGRTGRSRGGAAATSSTAPPRQTPAPLQPNAADPLQPNAADPLQPNAANTAQAGDARPPKPSQPVPERRASAGGAAGERASRRPDSAPTSSPPPRPQVTPPRPAPASQPSDSGANAEAAGGRAPMARDTKPASATTVESPAKSQQRASNDPRGARSSSDASTPERLGTG